MADQQDHRIRRLEELESENGVLRENLARYKALEEDLLSQKVYDKARKSLSVWLSGGGVVILILGYIGIGVISNQIVDVVVPTVEKKADNKVKEILKDFKQDLTKLKTEIFLKEYKGTKGTVQRRSELGNTQIEIEFVNRLDEMVVVYWIDYKGVEKEYFKLRPKESKKQMTYVTHPWIVRKEKNKEEVGSIIGQLRESD